MDEQWKDVSQEDASSSTWQGDADEPPGAGEAARWKGGKQKGNRSMERTPLLSNDTDDTSTADPRSSSDDDDAARRFTDKYGAIENDQFTQALVEAEHAIRKGVFPERIAQGSSGSYFVRNYQGHKIAVFKPKNEEPYGQLNPKWMKWIHRIFFPCCFGRSCLLPNQGYLSEAGASLIDRKLQLGVVPQTAVVSLAAPTFNYSPFDRAKARTKERIRSRLPDLGKRFRRVGLPRKTGSFQLFVHDFQDAGYWLRLWEAEPRQAPDPAAMLQLQVQFERMVILDYIIRNTDRGNDNWLISYHKQEAVANVVDCNASVVCEEDEQLIDLSHTQSIDIVEHQPAADEHTRAVLKVAAIDNGLAFPFKHPDQWRAYPYHWAWLPMAEKAFSEETVALVLPAVDSTAVVRELCDELRLIFKEDPGFNKAMFERQLSVLRGQLFNLREALKQRKSPQQLVQMPPQLIVEVKKKKKKKKKRERNTTEREEHNPTSGEESAAESPSTSTNSWHEVYQQKVQTRSAFFSWW